MTRRFERPPLNTGIGQHRLKYLKLKNELLDQFQTGQLRPGDSLPTVQELSTVHQLAPNTVRRALGELDREGLIDRIRGRGTFVRQQAPVQNAPVKNTAPSGQGLFALIMPESHTGHYPALHHGFERVAAEEHTQVIVSSTDNDPMRQGNVILQLMSKDVTGVAIVPTITPTPTFQIEMLQKQGIPVVFCHRRVEGVRAPLVSIPFLEIGRMAGRELLKHGHRRAAMFYTLPLHAILPSPSARDYAVGLREVLRQASGDLPDEFVFSSDTDTLDLGTQEKEAWPKIKELFSRPDRPTAIMTSYDSMGEIVYMALERLGLRVPEDVSIISFGGKQRRGAIIRRLTSVVIDGEDIGRQAARLLNEMCSKQRSIHDTEDIQIPLGLSDGQSLAPAPNEKEK